jgi:hypothetical protein
MAQGSSGSRSGNQEEVGELWLEEHRLGLEPRAGALEAQLAIGGGLDLKPIGKGISNTGKRVVRTSRQLPKLSDDLERVGKTTQKVGDSLS